MLKATVKAAFVLSVVTIAPGAIASSLGQTQLIAAAPHAEPIVLQKAEAPVTGTVTVKHDGGKTSLAFSKDFSTNPNAPALQVVLMKSATPLKELKAPHFPLQTGTYTLVAPLRSAKGAQVYALPAGIDIKAYGSILIWCKVANATMAWAPLR